MSSETIQQRIDRASALRRETEHAVRYARLLQAVRIGIAAVIAVVFFIIGYAVGAK